VTTDTLPIEEELRALFAEIAPPAPPVWRLRGLFAEIEVPAAPSSRPHAPGAVVRRRFGRVRWGAIPAPRFALAVALVAALAVAGAVTYAQRNPTPNPELASALTVTVDSAGTALNCRLPISVLSSNSSTGFIVMGDGKPSFRPVRTSSGTYMPALDRWVDAFPQWVAPDGQSYVLQDSTETKTVVRIVDARGSRTLFKMNWSAHTRHPTIFAYTSMGILFMDDPSPDGSKINLELMDPATGTLRPLGHPGLVMPPLDRPGSGSSGVSYMRSGEAIWVTSYDGSNSSTAARYDLATGNQTTWWDGQKDGSGYVQVVAADSHGDPLIQVSATDLEHTHPNDRAGIHTRTVLMSSPHKSTVINQGKVGSPGVAGNLSPLSVTDGDSIWLAADDGAIWLYRSKEGMAKVAKVSTSAEGAPGVSISGPCR